MKTISGFSRTGVRRARYRAPAPVTYHAVIDGLISEMAHLLGATEPRKFSPPYKLVIIDNHGSIAFAGQAGQDGKMRPCGPSRRMRRSDFLANALITDRSLATRTFRIDCAAPKNASR